MDCSRCVVRLSYSDMQPTRSQTTLPTLLLAPTHRIGMAKFIKPMKAKSVKSVQSGVPGTKPKGKAKAVQSGVPGTQPKGKGILKKPAKASQSGPPGGAKGWEDFQIVPSSDNSGKAKTSEDKFGHLKLHGELKRAPAVVKHIQGGTLHSTTGCQSVKDFLRSLEKKGDGSWLQEWDAANYSDKRQIMERLKLQLDEKSVLTIRHQTQAGTRTETKQVRGWMSLWEVADVEKIPFDPKYSNLLKDCVAEDESKPHPNTTLASKGWRVYYHVKKKATTETLYHDEGHLASADAEPEDAEDWELGRQAITQAGLGKSCGRRSSSSDLGATSSKASKWKA